MCIITFQVLIVRFLTYFFQLLYFLLLARVIFSFIRLGRGANPTLLQVVRVVYGVTEPMLAPLRRIIRPIQMGGGAYLDLSPLIALLLLGVIRDSLVPFILRLLF